MEQGAKNLTTTGVNANWMVESLVCMPTVADAAKFWCVLNQMLDPNGAKKLYVFAWKSVSKVIFDNNSSLEQQMGPPDLKNEFTDNNLLTTGSVASLLLDTTNKIEVHTFSLAASTVTATEF